MNDYIFFMHDDVPDGHRRDAEWAAYFAKLREAGTFQGGSAIGDGICASKSSQPVGITRHLSGYIRISAPTRRLKDEGRRMNPIEPPRCVPRLSAGYFPAHSRLETVHSSGDLISQPRSGERM